MDFPCSASRAPFECAARLGSQFLLNLFYSREELSKPVDPGNLLLCFGKRNCGRAEPNAARKAPRDAALCCDQSPVRDLDMTYNANLSPHHDALAHTRAP